MCQPCERFIDDLPSGPLVDHLAVSGRRHAIAVRLKALDQPEAAVERIGRNERRGGKPCLAQCASERWCFWIKADPVMPRAMTGRIAARHQARVRGQRDRCRRIGMRKEHAVTRETVECWRVSVLVAVRANMIGAKCVDSDDDQVARRWWRRRRCTLFRRARDQEEANSRGGGSHLESIVFSPLASTFTFSLFPFPLSLYSVRSAMTGSTAVARRAGM